LPFGKIQRWTDDGVCPLRLNESGGGVHSSIWFGIETWIVKSAEDKVMFALLIAESAYPPATNTG